MRFDPKTSCLVRYYVTKMDHLLLVLKASAYGEEYLGWDHIRRSQCSLNLGEQCIILHKSVNLQPTEAGEPFRFREPQISIPFSISSIGWLMAYESYI